VFNATFNNISVISWRSVLLVEETGYPEKTADLSAQVTDKLYTRRKPPTCRKSLTKFITYCTGENHQPATNVRKQCK